MFLSTEEGHGNGQAVDLLTALLQYFTVLVYINAFGWALKEFIGPVSVLKATYLGYTGTGID